MQQQAQALIDWMKAGESISEPAKPLTPLQRADRWVHDHPGAAVSLLLLAALALAAIVGN